MNDSTQVVLRGVPVEHPSSRYARFVGLIWGPAGSGKTTLAATAPGTKLLLCFDNDGEVSLSDRDDVQVMKLYKATPSTVVQEFKTTDPYGLHKYLTEHPEVETLVFDSMTSYAYMALMEAVRHAGGKISMEQPGVNGYSYRNSLVLRAATTMLSISAKLERNIVFTTHEGSPDKDDEGNVVSVTMMLSENLANQVSLRINEVWHLADVEGKTRVISVRPHTRMKPMKTRMFDASSAAKFTWLDGWGIADWWHAWKNSGGDKIPLPPTSTIAKGGQKK